ncbi:hypothetical protein HRR83_002681 [Exophiala dermatitidis]|uniref:Uncharacterized protein n=2 Tax=Exophiala dermatitidis TaxID=5970 RepID=H6C037_EXODN|nr:uncharacterized protein HMPREF1120_05234 [Exophiala dermatitidis NIH/UT8656]KAJ4516906.1 hypothetical protein HRR75_003566 [Exophiala dermatitidis]EHY57186.1 hypothetical protein HMPREF1120_05234 [Exophiala dermatitidis NIH/UT8656]KAJ4520885.1 hypothetical protein HRR74_003886 [Exophiala dermatitidis]KAJ4522028.1 hypothetical protein HRR73_003227 [Exophiala dermatitidis]KAJ4537456.1 hypothetical protein HRR76_005458 [Exophiala dermatitidis]
MDALLDEQAAHQLETELRSTVRATLRTKRPVLTHLNADTTWLLSLSYPDSIFPPTGRAQYNILIDPWLDGPQEDVAGWFSKQWHQAKSSVQTIAQLEDVLRDVEALQLQDNLQDSCPKCTNSFIDAVAVSHEFTDHCHKETLLQIKSSVPVFGNRKAVRIIRSWRHFDTVLEIPTLPKDVDWRSTSISPLPNWIGIGRLVTSYDALNLHSAIVISVGRAQSSLDAAEAIIYTPHGIEAMTAAVIQKASPPITVLALLHGLHDISIARSKQLNFGGVNAVQAMEILRAKYWIGTHDEEKPASGLIAPLLRRKTVTVTEALTKVRESRHQTADMIERKVGLDPTCVELRNGESIVLE